MTVGTFMKRNSAADEVVMTPPRFSIVVPAFQAADTISAAIRSAQLQNVEPLEILVVDDGSTDGTADVVETLQRDDPRVHLFRQPRRGPAAARNEALRHARADLVTFLDADDLLLPEYLALMDAALELSPEAGFAFTDAWVLDDATGRVRRSSAMEHRKPKDLPEDATRLLQLLLRRNFVFVAATVRRRALERIGGWRDNLSPAEDYDLWLRLLAAGHPAVQVEGRLAVYRRRSGSNSSDHHQMLQSRAAIYRDVVESWSVDTRSRRIARRCLSQTERWIRRFDPSRTRPSPRLAASRFRARLREPGVWLDTAPPEVEELLARTAEPELVAVRSSTG